MQETEEQTCKKCRNFQEELIELRKQNAQLRKKLNQYELVEEKTIDDVKNEFNPNAEVFSNEELVRYGRQLILPDFNINAQKALKQAKVLVVGAGGLGCPNLLYLAGAGVGTLGVVDFDLVEASNLHRQVIHRSDDVGVFKVDSAKRAVKQLNPFVNCNAYPFRLDAEAARTLIAEYDIVVDASDNVKTRYLVNDACVLYHKPLVSGGALGLEGHIAVFNYLDGPCYRCCYPTPLPSNLVGNCSDNGVIGAVPGVIGCLQAIEVIKIICKVGNSLNTSQCVYDAWSGFFRNFKLRGKRSDCSVCGKTPVISNLSYHEVVESKKSPEVVASDYVLTPILQNRLHRKHIMSISEFGHRISDRNHQHQIIDVRPEIQFNICRFPDSINLPMHLIEESECASPLLSEIRKDKPVYVLCRRGYDSQDAVSRLIAKGFNNIFHVEGGLMAYSREIDNKFPIY